MRSVFMRQLLPLIVFTLVLFSIDARADIDSANVLDNVLERYQTAAVGWSAVITDRASWLFWTLVMISMVWTFGFMALRRADLGEFFAEFIRFTIFTGFFWWLLENGPNFSNSIIRSMRILGGNASGLGYELTPSNIMDIGFSIFFTVVDQSSFWSPVDTTIGVILAVIILAILAIIAVNMLLLLIAAWILSYAGIFFLGFGGSRWTSDMAINYYKTVFGIAIQLLVMTLIIGIGQTFINDYFTNMSSSRTIKELGVMLIASIILLVLVNKLPQMVSGIITGAGVGNTGIGQFGAGAAIGAAGMAGAAIATGGAMMGAAAANAAGGTQAIMAALKSAAGGGSSGGSGGPLMAGAGVGGGSSGGSELFSGGGSSSGGGGSGEASPFSQAAGHSTPSGSDGASFSQSGAQNAGAFVEDALSESDAQQSGSGGSSGGSMSGAGPSNGQKKNIVAAAAGTMAQVAMGIAVNKAIQIGDKAKQRVAETPGGKLAKAINERAGASTSPTFAENSISGEKQIDPAEEVAAFRDKDASGDGGNDKA